MVFLNNMLMTSSHMVFNIPLDLIYDQCYPLHVKTTSFCFMFVLVIVNPIILALVLKITWCQLLLVNVLLKLLDDSQAINYFKVWLRFPYHSICEKSRSDTHNIVKVLFFLKNLICELKFAKLEAFSKIKPGSDFICKYDKLKLWHSYQNLFDCAWCEPLTWFL